jgi:hypothetical protein
LIVDLRVFQHLAPFDFRRRRLAGKEMIIGSVDLARRAAARRARNRIDEVGRGPQIFAERGLAGAGGRGDDEENALASEDGRVHSIF